jgi:catechol 2,3-dioxygenase-like lactoylglutathione lyase family enzyme
MIDHLTIRVANYDRSKAFYTAALAPLGFRSLMEFEAPGIGKFGGLGAGKPELWLAQATPEHVVPFGQHIALGAERRAQVDAFHAAALAAGASDDGAPGLRPHYHPHYYGAFVIDPDGIHLEVCTHHPE